jgi:acetate kinase
MGSRAGDIDQGVIFYLVSHLGYPLEKVKQMLSSESGMLGLTGYSDLRDIQKAAASGDKDCKLALEMNAYRIKKYIGAYTAVMNGLDGLVFTAGIGEHSALLRAMVCSDMEYLGIRLDSVKNQNPGKGLQALHHKDSTVSIWVVPTNEELQIAREVFQKL